MVTPATDPEAGKDKWAYDPHIDPSLNFDPSRGKIEALIDDALASNDQEQMKAALAELKRLQSPYLNWSGKAERTSFEVDSYTVKKQFVGLLKTSVFQRPRCSVLERSGGYRIFARVGN